MACCRQQTRYYAVEAIHRCTVFFLHLHSMRWIAFLQPNPRKLSEVLAWALLHAGHHDDAYHWASNRKVEFNDKTGALQIVEVVESVEEIVPKRASWQVGLLDAYEDDYLLSLGVPNDWLPVLRQLITADDLLNIIERLPEEVSERLAASGLGGTGGSPGCTRLQGCGRQCRHPAPLYHRQKPGRTGENAPGSRWPPGLAFSIPPSGGW
jgi:hypothetical protein